MTRSPASIGAAPSPRRLDAPQDGVDARNELPGGERLHDVVISAQAQARDPVGFLPARGEQDHGGRVGARGTESPHHLEAVDAGQHQIQDDEVGPDALGGLECLLAVVGDVRLVARALEVARDDLGDRLLVVDDEDSGAAVSVHVHCAIVQLAGREIALRRVRSHTVQNPFVAHPGLSRNGRRPLQPGWRSPFRSLRARVSQDRRTILAAAPKFRRRPLTKESFMRALRLTVSILAAAALPLAFSAAPALADHGGDRGTDTIYTSTNAAAGNAVLAFDRGPGGALTPAGSFATGGAGTGSGLGNQGAIALDGNRLYVVNAGSADISVFAVRHHGLALLQRIASGGTTPISLTVSRDVLYALNAGGTGNVSGFRVGAFGLLRPIPGAAQPLAGAGPAQVAFSSDGRTLVVTEKGTNTIDTFAVGFFGRAAPAVSRPSNGATPFGFAFDRAGHAIVSEAHGGAAGASTVSSYDVRNGAFTSISASVPDFQGAACWVTVAGGGRYAYVANTGSADISGFRIARDGSISLLDASGVTAAAGAAPADIVESGDGRAVFVRNGGDGSISAYRERFDGSLLPTGTIAGIPAGATGLAAE